MTRATYQRKLGLMVVESVTIMEGNREAGRQT